MRALPIGVPKVLISSIASGDVGRYVGPADITMMYSVTDVQGLNSISRQVLANGAHALIGMVKARLDGRAARRSEADLPAVGLTMFGVTTPCVQQIAAALARATGSAWSSTPPASAAERWRSWSTPACWPP